MKTAAITLAAILAAAYAVSRAADMAAGGDQVNGAAGEFVGMDAADGATVLDYLNPWGAIERQWDNYQASSNMSDSNCAAFLAMIAKSEGTDRAADPYRVCYGYRHTIQRLDDHPAVTGEWTGESIANLGPQYAGMVSTAAGRYQIIKASWLEGKRALGLPDFSADSQDRWALWKISKRGALDDVKAGRIADAIDKCRAEWASLPGAGYGQPERKLSTLLAAFESAGGVLA